MIRSMMFVPADSEKKLARAASLAADALVLDLEDSVLPDRKPLARGMIKEYLAASSERARMWVRVNDLASGELLKDLPAVVESRPAGIVLPKIRGPEDLQIVSTYLDALEAAYGVDAGAIGIVPVVTETPLSVLRLGETARIVCPRLRAMTWGGEDLSAALGAGDPRDEHGAWRSMYAMARNHCLLTAHALSVAAIDTVYVDFRNSEGLRAACAAARYDGFTGRLAIHPDQIEIINAAFTPSADELAFAQRVIDAFKSGAGAVQLDGKMFDIPHLKAAKRLLGQP